MQLERKDPLETIYKNRMLIELLIKYRRISNILDLCVLVLLLISITIAIVENKEFMTQNEDVISEGVTLMNAMRRHLKPIESFSPEILTKFNVLTKTTKWHQVKIPLVTSDFSNNLRHFILYISILSC